LRILILRPSKLVKGDAYPSLPLSG